ncbi:Mitochondrial transcription termination factor, mTERF [Handroanthus impetiginosus]|uniref:Mitochondrial transcription termination factor, mTERF n=1 Tax=Handroanthus impetiginosus TaxID=429701 RepID=A0A2G9HY14_9LAMI|nr:Mitochondrial transcription termination factor, mTERF [Handroanthus impetiginosus]
MIALIPKNITGLFPRNASSVCKFHSSLSLSHRFFSTPSEKQLVTNRAVFDFLLHKHHFSPKVASRVASVLTELKDPENADSVLLFLRESGFSNTQLEKIVKYRPWYLKVSLGASIKPKIKIFQDLGFSSDDIAKIISSNPVILQLNPNTRVIPSLSVLKGFLGSNDDVAKLLRRSGWFLTTDLEKTMVPNFELLKSYGISMQRIIRILYSYPRYLLLKPESLRESAQKAQEMGFNWSSKMFIHAIRVVASMSSKTWEAKLQAFRNFGFSEGEIMTMFRKAPPLFGLSVEKIKKTKDVLLATGKYSLSCIINNPMSLGCSVEKRYEPWLQVLGILENKNLIKRWPSLGTIYPMSDKKFFEKFVCPHLNDVGEVFILRNSVKDRREKNNDLLKELG